MTAATAEPLTSLVTVAALSFLTALTGAVSPGPLLTYTIVRSARARKRGYLVGLWVIAGHAVVELGILLGLLLGFAMVLHHPSVVRFISLAGGLILVCFGGSIVREALSGSVSTAFLTEAPREPSTGDRSPKGLANPILGGGLVSMSNPYWWVWWGTIGAAFMSQFGVTAGDWPRVAAFFLGHEAGDLAWYFLVSSLTFFGLRYITRRIYLAVLICCGLFMTFFGLYLALAPLVAGLAGA